ncbi:ubiquitin-like protein ATG12 [Rhizoctonia solani]|uniref:Ubiquitin-like protein ATG12 n=1 Tax=Rhizoctonia solani TaxID=456999 RepID=A0A8H8NXI4_9AGAM|nr:ubiquitin-like protein ATG12 [Rhizoctonia solani]QRW21754.1 ubiquitin-like protein ATG12 [Rhizoctonia solani]
MSNPLTDGHASIMAAEPPATAQLEALQHYGKRDVSKAFSPAPDDTVANLFKCFATDGHLIVNYRYTVTPQQPRPF